MAILQIVLKYPEMSGTGKARTVMTSAIVRRSFFVDSVLHISRCEIAAAVKERKGETKEEIKRRKEKPK